jgi:hypothetical protein
MAVKGAPDVSMTGCYNYNWVIVWQFLPKGMKISPKGEFSIDDIYNQGENILNTSGKNIYLTGWLSLNQGELHVALDLHQCDLALTHAFDIFFKPN